MRESATTREASHGTTDAAHPRKFALAIVAAIKITADQFACRQWQFVTSAFACDAQISTSATPFSPVRKNPTATRAMLRQEMGKFMTQSAFDLVSAKLL